MASAKWPALYYVCAALAQCVLAGELDEFKVKRQEVYEFTEKPSVTANSYDVKIVFQSKAYCDATVVIEDAKGKIARHLASGVLGPNAPEPFQKNSLKQELLWDSKNDQGEYVKDRASHTVRVSLGLKPQYEKTLFWSPHKRISETLTFFRCAPEGIYVYDADVYDHLRLFDHQGKYLRTIYPFPREKLEQVQGLAWHDFVQTGKKAPLKAGYHQSSLLTSGTNTGTDSTNADEGQAAFAMAVRNDRIALSMNKLNRLATDGSSGGLPLEGPEVCITTDLSGQYGQVFKDRRICPWSLEFSPDGKHLYLAGYAWTFWDVPVWGCLSGVQQIDYGENATPRLFVGSVKPGETGAGDTQFHCATSVACDAQGRVYVSDYMNNRIQVFDATGKLIKSVPANKPAQVRVHQKTGEIFVFSWPVHNPELSKDSAWQKVTPMLTHLGAFDNPKRIAEYPLPLTIFGNWWAKHPPGPMYCGEIDSWSEPVTVWVSSLKGRFQDRGMGHEGDGFTRSSSWDQGGIQAFTLKDGKLVPMTDFGKEAAAAVVRTTPAILCRQRLFVNPKNERLYVAEGDSGVMKSVNQLVEIDPETGKVKLVDLPLGAEDLCFDINGQIYLRTDIAVARYDPETWREIPFDYGEELDKHSYGMGAREANLQSALGTPGHRSFSFWHLGGIDVSSTGHIVVTTCNGQLPADRKNVEHSDVGFKYTGSKYSPQIYPGRMTWGEIHVWDKHGKLLIDDAAPGMGHLDGIGIDSSDNLYMLVASRRLFGGKPFDPGMRDTSGTLVKLAAKRGKVLSAGGNLEVPLQGDSKPARPMELAGMTTGWVDDAAWFYGGTGFCTPGACICWNCRFCHDYLNRSFAPEPQVYSVAVLDGNGNLICRVGQYGNVDDGKPLDPTGGPPSPRSIGGDETGLMNACYVATHSDRRLFIADGGNARIVSVKLGYHAEEKIALHDVADAGKP